MPSLTKLINKFCATGTNGCLDLSLFWKTFNDPFKRPYSIWSGIHSKPRRMSLLVGKAKLAGCLKVCVGGLLEWNAGIQ